MWILAKPGDRGPNRLSQWRSLVAKGPLKFAVIKDEGFLKLVKHFDQLPDIRVE